MDGNEIIKKYLDNYAEPEATAAQAMTYHYQHVVIIPAYNEFESLLDTLDSIKEKNVLAIVVVNSITDDCETAVSTNQKLLKTLRKNYFEIWRAKSGQGISLHQLDNVGLLLIDRCSGQLKLPEKCGVGLARKIAADVALGLIYNNNVKSTWIHSTDADVILPNDYFSRTNDLPIKTSAAIYPYHHTINNDCENHKNAVLMYEIALRHYVIGLKHAGSPYAFHTIGSTIAVRSTSYAAVRGFPKREAGEDFYMLNKLAKIGGIERLIGDPIHVSGRVSDRVPFGTGQAVNKIIGLENPTNEYEYYNPKIFTLLQFWLNEVKHRRRA